MPITDLEIVVGTYEEFILGYKVTKEENNKHRFVQSFADHAHRASIRSLSAKGKYLASGSADESIALYDMRSRKQAGVLTQHSDTVTCLSFSPNGSHLLSASEDGSLAVFRTGSWQLEKIFTKAHNGSGIIHLSVHPSGKLALSVGIDATLRTWNLVKGRQAYATNLGKSRTGSGRAVTCLLWSPDGNAYVIAIGTELHVYDVSTAGIIYTVQLQKKITCICFIKDSELAIGDEGGGLTVHDITEKKELFLVNVHEDRIKCLSCVTVGDERFLVTTSSSGEIKLWKCKAEKLKKICKINTDCRITSLVVLTRSSLKSENVSNEKESDLVKKELPTNSKKPRENSDGSPKSKKLKIGNKMKSKHLAPQQTSTNSVVICTRGQKWIVEDL